MKVAKTFAIAAFLATFIIFAPALRNGFIPDWDDGRNLLDNPMFRGFGFSNLAWMFTTFLGGPYQPLSWLSYAVDHALWGMNPTGYHLTNLLLHAVNAALFQRLGARLLKSETLGLLAALLFALHPLRVESVAWVTERRDVLSGLFLLLATLAYLDRRMAASVAFFACSLLSKAIALGFPIALLCLNIVERRQEPIRELLREKIPYFVVAALAGAVALFGQAHTGATMSLEDFPAAPRLLMSIYDACFYLWKTLLPFGLSPLYELPYEMRPLFPAFAVSCLGFLVLCAVCWHQRSRRPALGLAWLAYLALIFPVLGFVKFGMQAAADRYTYIACMPLALLAAAAASHRTVAVALTAWCFGLAGLSFAQVQLWKDERTLWTYALQTEGPHAVPLFQLAGLARQEWDLGLAETMYQGALQVRPDFAEAHNNLGAVLATQGRKDEAKEHFEAALRLRPGYEKAAQNLQHLQQHSPPRPSPDK